MEAGNEAAFLFRHNNASVPSGPFFPEENHGFFLGKRLLKEEKKNSKQKKEIGDEARQIQQDNANRARGDDKGNKKRREEAREEQKRQITEEDKDEEVEENEEEEEKRGKEEEGGKEDEGKVEEEEVEEDGSVERRILSGDEKEIKNLRKQRFFEEKQHRMEALKEKEMERQPEESLKHESQFRQLDEVNFHEAWGNENEPFLMMAQQDKILPTPVVFVDENVERKKIMDTNPFFLEENKRNMINAPFFQEQNNGQYIGQKIDISERIDEIMHSLAVEENEEQEEEDDDKQDPDSASKRDKQRRNIDWNGGTRNALRYNYPQNVGSFPQFSQYWGFFPRNHIQPNQRPWLPPTHRERFYPWGGISDQLF